MKVLFVCSGNATDLSPFIREQRSSLEKQGIEIGIFSVKGHGISGYLKNLPALRRRISEFHPDLIHAHYGLSGFLANLQRVVPVINTFHGTDLNVLKRTRILSNIAHLLSAHSIVVEQSMSRHLWTRKKVSVIPCGVDVQLFKPGAEVKAHTNGYPPNPEVTILFSSCFNNHEKNYPLAKKAVDLLGPNYRLIELKGYSREKVSSLLNQCNLALMTSLSEGSPQFIKEAMACNCPVVTTNVGDVKKVMGNTGGCFLTSYDPEDVAKQIHSAAEFSSSHERTNGRDRLLELGYDLETIALKIIGAYNAVIKK